MPDNWIPETRSRLAQRRARKPDTKAGQLWALWPEIKAARAEGQSVRTILEWLREDAGIVLSIGSLTSYISRNRKKEAARRLEQAAEAVRRTQADKPARGSPPQPASTGAMHATPQDGQEPPPETVEPDPVARTLQALRKRRFDIREAHRNGDPTNVKLI